MHFPHGRRPETYRGDSHVALEEARLKGDSPRPALLGMTGGW